MCSNENGLRSTRPLQFESLELRRVFSAAPISEPAPATAWSNHANPADVNQDGRLTSLDALQVINALNHYGHQELASSNVPHATIVDANLDRWLSSLDVLAIVNQINAVQRTSNDAANAQTPPVDTLNTPAPQQPLQPNIAQSTTTFAPGTFEKAELDGTKYDLDGDGFITPKDIDAVIQHLAANDKVVADLKAANKPFDYRFYEKASGNLAYLDVYRDGFISAKDIELKIIQAADENQASPTETDHVDDDRFDINQDGVVNTDDALEVLKRVFAYNQLVPCTCANCLANALLQ